MSISRRRFDYSFQVHCVLLIHGVSNSERSIDVFLWATGTQKTEAASLRINQTFNPKNKALKEKDPIALRSKAAKDMIYIFDKHR